MSDYLWVFFKTVCWMVVTLTFLGQTKEEMAEGETGLCLHVVYDSDV